MINFAIKKRCIRCLSVLDAAGHCTNEQCVRYTKPTETTQQEAPQAAETATEK